MLSVSVSGCYLGGTNHNRCTQRLVIVRAQTLIAHQQLARPKSGLIYVQFAEKVGVNKHFQAS